MRLACSQLAKKEPEAAYGKANAHQTKAGTNPRQKGSLGRKIYSRILLRRLFHAGIVCSRAKIWLVLKALLDCAFGGRTREQPSDANAKLLRIEGRADFHVVVEVDKYIPTLSLRRVASAGTSSIRYFLSPRPRNHTASPNIECVGLL